MPYGYYPPLHEFFHELIHKNLILPPKTRGWMVIPQGWFHKTFTSPPNTRGKIPEKDPSVEGKSRAKKVRQHSGEWRQQMPFPSARRTKTREIDACSIKEGHEIKKNYTAQSN